MTRMAGMEFSPARSSFPAVTCVAQADLRTGLGPAEHGMVANGWWDPVLRKPLFWEQSSALVKGGRIWSARRAAGGRVGLFFLQQSLGEQADVIVSPTPIHRHGGGMVMATYTKPAGMDEVLRKLSGRFPLWRYWGPLASPKIGRRCIAYFKAMTDVHDVDEAYLYLPTLDYTAQRFGPSSREHLAALKEFRRQLETLVDIAVRRGAEIRVRGDYEITEVVAPPVRPNVLLRREGLFRTRLVGGRSYPDFHESAAFAMCDHEFCVLCGERAETAAEKLLAAGGYELPAEGDRVAGSVILLAKPGSWCEYKWWTDEREAPDFASHVDIHNKPGFDPAELFFFGRGTVRGTHGRRCETAEAGR